MKIDMEYAHVKAEPAHASRNARAEFLQRTLKENKKTWGINAEDPYLDGQSILRTWAVRSHASGIHLVKRQRISGGSPFASQGVDH